MKTFVDPAISRKKLERELDDFRKLASIYRQRGIWLLEYQFPEVIFALAAVNSKPTLLVPYGVLLDFSNYNVLPPSVRLVNPITKAPLKRSEIPYDFRRQRSDGQVEALLHAFDDTRPFICLQGVREYHENPAHTGDSWFLHRGTGAGTLVQLLNILARYGADPIVGQQIQLQMSVVGLNVSPPPQ